MGSLFGPLAHRLCGQPVAIDSEGKSNVISAFNGTLFVCATRKSTTQAHLLGQHSWLFGSIRDRRSRRACTDNGEISERQRRGHAEFMTPGCALIQYCSFQWLIFTMILLCCTLLSANCCGYMPLPGTNLSSFSILSLELNRNLFNT